jgi:hypothetical protein
MQGKQLSARTSRTSRMGRSGRIGAIGRLPGRGLALAQRGFLMAELFVYLGIVAIIAIYANQKIVNDVEESLATGSGVYLQTVAAAAQSHILVNFNAYSNNTPVAGVTTLLQPTVAELVALNRLNGGFPAGVGAMPTRQTARIDITRTGCPGIGCQITALVCTTTPIALGGAQTRFDLASTMVSAQNGTGGQSLLGSGGATITGPALSVANPLGNVEGIVCGSGRVDAGMFENFVRMNDARDPNLQGNLTVAGTTNLNGAANIAGALTANGTTRLNGNTDVGACAQILAATGRAGFGCTTPNDLPAGYTGGVRTPDLVASGRILASDNPAAFTGTNGNYVFAGLQGGVAEMRTSGRVQANRLVPSGAFTVGAACAAADVGAIARDAGNTGLVVCRDMVWRTLITFQTAGGACAPNGAEADDGTGAKLLCIGSVWRAMANLFATATAGSACTTQGVTAYDTTSNNEMLLCRLNPAQGTLRWFRLRELTSNMMFVFSYEVAEGSTVTIPTCSSASGITAYPIIQLIPKVFTTPDGGFAAYAETSGSNWVIRLRNGANGALGGSPGARAIANTYCYFG